MLLIWEIIKYWFPFCPFGNFLIIGVEEFRIIEHKFSIWIKHLCDFLLLISVIYPKLVSRCNYFMLMKLSLMPTWTCSGPTWCHWCHQVPSVVAWPLTEWGLHLAVPWIPYRVGLCPEAPCTQLTRSLYPQDWILMPPPCWRCWRPWRWSWRPNRSWRSPRWVEEALMTHYVVIHALMVSCTT